MAGKRAGLAGARSGLWFPFQRILARLRPRWVVIENVPGLLSSARGEDFAAVIGGLAELGYLGAWRVLDARYFGLAQRRRRVLIVGCLGDPARAAEVLLEPEGGEWHPAAGREAGEDVAGTLGGGSGERGWAADTDRMTFVPELAPTMPSFSASAHGSTTDPQFTDRALVVSRPLTAHPTGYRLDGETDGAHPGSGAGQDAYSGQLVVEGVHANQRGEIRTSRLAGSLNASHSGKQFEGVAVGPSVRRLTPLECERLQGFADGWTEGHSDSVRYRMLGNAVAVPVAEWVLRRIGGSWETRR